MSDQVVEMTKDDLMRDIRKEVESATKLSEERVMAILADKIGKDKTEQIKDESSRLEADLAGLKGEARQIKLDVLQNRSFDCEPEELPQDARELGWGKGKLFTSFAMLIARATREYGKDRALAHVKQAAQAAGNNQLVRMIDMAETRTLQAGEMSGAGALIPQLFSADFIELLRSATVVRASGAVIHQMAGGTEDIGRQNGSATANWIGENTVNPVSQQTFGRLKLSAKKLGVKVPVSNDAMRRAANFSSIVTSDMQAVAARAEDAAFLRGSGTSYTPNGMINQAASGQFIATAGATYANLITDLTGCLARVYGTDVVMARPSWFLSANDYWAGILKILVAGGQDATWLRDQFTGSNTLFGVPVRPTSAIPTNLGGGTNASELYLLEASQFVIGETLNMSVEEFNGGTYTDASSNLVSGIDTDETVLRLIHEVDCALRHTNAVAGCTGVNYAGRS